MTDLERDILAVKELTDVLDRLVALAKKEPVAMKALLHIIPRMLDLKEEQRK